MFSLSRSARKHLCYASSSSPRSETMVCLSRGLSVCLLGLSERVFVQACRRVPRRILPPSRESRKPSRGSVAMATAAAAGWQEALVFHFCHPLLTAARLHRMAGRSVESRARPWAGWRPWDPDGRNCRGGGL